MATVFRTIWMMMMTMTAFQILQMMMLMVMDVQIKRKVRFHFLCFITCAKLGLFVLKFFCSDVKIYGIEYRLPCFIVGDTDDDGAPDCLDDDDDDDGIPDSEDEDHHTYSGGYPVDNKGIMIYDH